MKAGLDALLSRKEVDPERLAAYGISAGGYIVPRAASREPRIRACIVNSIIPDLYALLAGTSIPKLKGITRRLAQWKAPFLMRMLELIAWRWGVDARDVALLVEKNRDLHYNPQDISCPTLILIGEGENANPRVNQVQRESLRSLPDKRSRLLIGPLEEGAAGHCMGENLPLMSAMVFDWLDDVFA
jgi:pimeloyl-ACP methyl ester carboxylesterase